MTFKVLGPFGLCMLVAATGCTGDTAMTQIAGAPDYPDAGDTLTINAEASFHSLASDQGTIIGASTDGAYWVDVDMLRELEVRADADHADSTGAVFSMTARPHDLLLATENGLFETWSQELLQSPLNSDFASVTISALDSTGQDALWAAANDGLYQIADGSLTRWSVDERETAASHVCDTGSTVLVSYGTELYELDPTAGVSVLIDVDLGAIHGMVRGDDGVAFLATDAGLVMRENSGDYRQYTLSNSTEPRAVHAVSHDSVMGVVAATDDGLVGLDADGAITGYAAFASPTTANGIALDDLGYAWIAEGNTLNGHLIGSVVGFASDVQPILETNCNHCHLNGANGPAVDFSDYETVVSLADTIMERVAAGEMPPTESLRPTDFEILSRWFRSGQQP